MQKWFVVLRLRKRISFLHEAYNGKRGLMILLNCRGSQETNEEVYITSITAIKNLSVLELRAC